MQLACSPLKASICDVVERPNSSVTYVRFVQKADLTSRSRHVRCSLKVDIRQRVEHVRLVPEAEIRHGTAALAKWNGWHGQRADGGQLAPIRDQC